MQNFSPFSKSLSDLTGEDLVCLKSCSESWYVEYKRELSNARTIAKSISALANTYGGWLFFGVQETSNGSNEAGEFPGCSTIDREAHLNTIRQAVANGLHGDVHYDVKVICGPEPRVGLPDGQCIICVQVEQGMRGPVIHSSGVVYRRVGNGSEPRPETDRSVIDGLFRRSDEYLASFRTYIDRDPDFDENEKGSVYIRLIMMADPWLELNGPGELSLNEARRLFSKTDNELISLPFSAVHMIGDKIVARQSENNRPGSLPLTWTFGNGLVSDVSIPVPTATCNHNMMLKWLDGYDQAKAFCDALFAGYRNTEVKVADLSPLARLCMGFATTQLNLLDKFKCRNEVFIKVKALNASRVTPFIDTSDYLDDARKHGFPLCVNDSTSVPRGREPDDMRRVDLTRTEDRSGDVLNLGIDLFLIMAQAFGISLHDGERAILDIGKIYQAGEKMDAVQRLRNRTQR